jgi:hypothetical protein
MYQWEDWQADYNWHLLVEKAAATLVVVSLSIYLWRLVASVRREAAVGFRVPIPSQLTTKPYENPAAEVSQSGPAEEVSMTILWRSALLILSRFVMDKSTHEPQPTVDPFRASPSSQPQSRTLIRR